MPYDNKALIGVVNSQGYLLQQAVEHIVRTGNGTQINQWNVVSSEHYWENTDREQSGYIDLLIRYASDGIMGVVECKRYAEETPWIFLCPDDEPADVRYSSLYWAHKTRQFGNKMGFYEFVYCPTSRAAKFCIVRGQAKEKPMLERIAGELLYSVEALAKQYSSLPNIPSGSSIFVPIIVTTAQLYICKYDQQNIEPESGTLNLDHAQFEKVPFIRFHKVFTNTDVDLNSIEQFSEIEKRQSQTVMVVQINSLSEFLSSRHNLTSPGGVMRMPWQPPL
ncbi:MAG: hypothetical protein IT328_05900 [Caldilineaceae bacterium]|nr:hypothetical protein [Caldilineaceae bacterium]